jgi:hypothetical protein
VSGRNDEHGHEWWGYEASGQGLASRHTALFTADKMMGLPHADNLYIRVEWRDVQKDC